MVQQDQTLGMSGVRCWHHKELVPHNEFMQYYAKAGCLRHSIERSPVKLTHFNLRPRHSWPETVHNVPFAFMSSHARPGTSEES